MSERNAPTVPMSDELLEEIDARLDYGDSRAAWIREAVRERLDREQHDGDGASSHDDVPADD